MNFYKSKRHDLIDMFNDTSRYLDDIFTIDNPEFEKKHIHDTWSCPSLGIACVLMLRPISPGLVLVRSPLFVFTNFLLNRSGLTSYGSYGDLGNHWGFYIQEDKVSISRSRTF